MSEEKLRQDMERLHRIGDELIQAWKLNDDIEQEWSELKLIEIAKGTDPAKVWDTIAATSRGKELRALSRIRRFDLKEMEIEYDRAVRALDIQIALEPHRLMYSSE